jgi:hypothetical protein
MATKEQAAALFADATVFGSTYVSPLLGRQYYYPHKKIIIIIINMTHWPTTATLIFVQLWYT